MIAANHECLVSLFKFYKEFDERERERENFHDTRDFPHLFSFFSSRGNRDAIAETCHGSAINIFVDVEPAFCRKTEVKLYHYTRNNLKYS